MTSTDITRTVLTAKALLFDMDGTLVDSTAVVEHTWAQFAQRHGLSLAEILIGAHGRRTSETVARFAPSGVDVDAESRRIAASEVDATDGIVEIPGAQALLRSLPPDRWALVTSAGRRLAERRMAICGLPVPRVVISADDVRAGKPSPEGYTRAARELGYAPSETIVFEDAEPGVVAARAAGAQTVVVGSALAAGATHGLDRVADLRSVRVLPNPGGWLEVQVSEAV